MTTRSVGEGGPGTCRHRCVASFGEPRLYRLRAQARGGARSLHSEGGTRVRWQESQKEGKGRTWGRQHVGEWSLPRDPSATLADQLLGKTQQVQAKQ